MRDLYEVAARIIEYGDGGPIGSAAFGWFDDAFAIFNIRLLGGLNTSGLNGKTNSRSSCAFQYLVVFEGYLNVRCRVKLSALFPFLLIAGVFAGCGYRWDAVSAPDMQGANALAAVEAFIATNGWNMQTSGPTFDVVGQPWRKIRGLPWRSFKDRDLPAVTQNGILYVLSNPGWHHDTAGVAYNPHTNKFGPTIRGFKPIGGHWYVWFQPEFQSRTLQQQYE